MKFQVFAAAAATLLLALPVQAATGPKGGPSDSWTQMQKYEFYVGELAGALNLCRITDLAYDLKEVADLSPYGRKGWRSMLPFDGIRGGRCTTYVEAAREVLADRDKLTAYLKDQYDCSTGECDEADSAASSPCRTELDEYLAGLPIEADDIRSLKVMTLRPAIRERSNARFSHQVRVDLKSCSGYLEVQLTESCYPRNTFTRGDCEIEGISSY
ncbi:MAG: hypothetical protein Tsb0032_37130 [Kiloniellaceae bacterium]